MADDERNKLCCTNCAFTTKHRQSLRRHRLMVHERVKKAMCEQCGFRAFDKFDLKKHMQRHEHSDLHRCYKCKMGFKNVLALRSHMADHLPVEERSAATEINISDVIKSHIQRKSVHGVLFYVCSICMYQTVYKTDLRKHIKLHYKIKDASCQYCSKIYACKSDLYRHERNAHNIKKTYECNKCHLSFDNYVKFRNHRGEHLTEASEQRQRNVSEILQERRQHYQNTIGSGTIKRKTKGVSMELTNVASQNWVFQGEAQSDGSQPLNTVLMEPLELDRIGPQTTASATRICGENGIFSQDPQNVQAIDYFDQNTIPSTYGREESKSLTPGKVKNSKSNEVFATSVPSNFSDHVLADVENDCDENIVDPFSVEQSAGIEQLVTYSLEKLNEVSEVHEGLGLLEQSSHSNQTNCQKNIYGLSRPSGMETMLSNTGGESTFSPSRSAQLTTLSVSEQFNDDVDLRSSYNIQTFPESSKQANRLYQASDEIYIPNEPKFDLLSDALRSSECFDPSVTFLAPEQVPDVNTADEFSNGMQNTRGLDTNFEENAAQLLLIKHVPDVGEERLFSDVIVKIPMKQKLLRQQQCKVEMVPWK